MTVLFGSDLRPGMVFDGHLIESVTRQSAGGDYIIRFSDGSQTRQVGWNQQVSR
jgi:hypothetical protein